MFVINFALVGLAVGVEGRDDALLVDLLLSRYWWRSGLDLAGLALLLTLSLCGGCGPLGLRLRLGSFGFLGVVLARVDGRLQGVVAVPVLQAGAHHVGEGELLALPAQQVVGGSG